MPNQPPYHTFSYSPREGCQYDHASVRVETSAEELSKVLEAVMAYLKACGFQFKIGDQLEVVNEHTDSDT
jgi:hypothetical protein